MNRKNQNNIFIKGASENNLKNIDINIPKNKLIVFTGISGSGKSSLAFGTIYAEGRRRYVESLSSYARQFLGQMEKPEVEYIEGLSPSISIEQKSTSKNPRSTVGTITEIYDYMRLLYARIGKQHCYKCKAPVAKQTVQEIVDQILKFPTNTKFQIIAPIIRSKKGEFKDVIESIFKQGFVRIRVDGKVYYSNDDIILKKTIKHNIEVVIDRVIMKNNIKERITESIELGLKAGSGLIMVDDSKNLLLFSEHYACSNCNISYEALEPRHFSFNSPYGACEFCVGLGTHMRIDPDLVVPDDSKSLIEGAILPLGEQPRGNWASNILKNLSSIYNFSFHVPWKSFSEQNQKILLYGNVTNKKKSRTQKKQFTGEKTIEFEGVIPNLERRYQNTNSSYIRDWIERFMAIQPCPKCNGAKLKKSSLAVLIDNNNIDTLNKFTIESLNQYLDNYKLSKVESEIASQIIKEIKSRLEFLISVGLNYLTLNRTANTLSGGESQRIRLATQIGSQLSGVIYILDEPSIGLHQKDNNKLIHTLKKLRDLNNTIIVVEHDQEMMEAADWIVDIGPGAGVHGGKIVFSGKLKDILKSKASITGKYLSGKKTISIRKKKRSGNGKFLLLNGASGNNLKNVNLKIPLGMFVCITGVSGSGKSTLINHTLYPILAKEYFKSIKKPLKYNKIDGSLYLDKVININQSPIGKTPRSNPGTYTGLFIFIRELFSKLPESKIRGYLPGRFSFNVKGGRCEKCHGAGIIKIEMHFLADMYIACETCGGKRYNRETLQIFYRGKNIYEVLDMTVEEALEFFKNHLQIHRKLEALNMVGLGYVKLGQQVTTLSGGESQRIKLASELSKIGTGRTLYLLDEPTTGLHFADINMLLKVLHKLADKGNTIIVIEHNMEIIKSADWLVDLGPDGGKYGGEIIAQGAPNIIKNNIASHTGKYLKKFL